MIGRVAARWIGRLAKAPEVVYVAVFLPPMERARLVKRFGKKHPTLVAHHMTVWFQDDGGQPGLEGFPFGKTVSLKLLGHAEDENTQAVVVKPPAGLKPRAGRIPHITVSVAAGASAKMSNALLAKPDAIVWESGLPAVEGKVGWWDGEKERFDPPRLDG